jgi:chromosome segregation ATPase
MATASAKNKCVICQKERSEVRCEYCFQTFCYKHLIDHRQEVDKTFDEIQMNHDEIRQTLNEQIADATKHYLVKQIDQWELDSIAVIQRTARECRQKVLVQIDEHLENLEARLTQLTDEIREAHRENDWNENNINQLKQEFTHLRTKLNQVPSILIQEDSKPFIKKITVFSTEGNHLFYRENNLCNIFPFQ